MFSQHCLELFKNTDYYIGTKESVKGMHSENGITYQETERNSVGTIQPHHFALYHESTKGLSFVFQILESQDVYWSDRVVLYRTDMLLTTAPYEKL